MNNQALRIRSGKFIKRAVAVAALVAFTVWAADGDLDTSYGNNGKTNINFANDTNDVLQAAHKHSSNNSFLFAGIGQLPHNDNSDPANHILFTATLSDTGVLLSNPTMRTTDIGATINSVNGGSIPSDDKILLAGDTGISGNFQAQIARFSVNASSGVVTPDAGGLFTRPGGGTNNESACSAVFAESSAANAKIVASCITGSTINKNTGRLAVIRLNSDLTADTRFGSSGGTAIVNSFPSGFGAYSEHGGNSSLVRDASGNYYLTGEATGDFTGTSSKPKSSAAVVIKLLGTNGALDSSFDGDGIAVVLSSTGDQNLSNEAVSIALDSTGKILVGGRKPGTNLNCTGCDDGFVARLTTSGALDNTFGTSGIFANNQGSTGDITSRALLPTADGKIYVLSGTDLFRLNSNGTRDTSFASSNAPFLNNKQNSDVSNWGGILQLDANSALLFGGVDGGDVGKNFCVNGSTTCTSPDQAIVAKVRLNTDTTPDTFSFASQTGVALNSTITSASAPITGINSPAAISVTTANGGTYSINGAAFTNAAGTITNGQSVRVQHTSSSAGSGTVTSTLSIGSNPGGSATFTSQTVAADTVPTNFTFNALTNQTKNAVIESNVVTISGINAPAAISISGGNSPGYAVDSGGGFSAFSTSSPATVNNGDKVKVRQTSSANPGTKTTTTLNVGTVTGAFDVTTGTDTTPNSFTISDAAFTAVATGTVITSPAFQVSGIDSPTPISINNGGSYNINGGGFTVGNDTVNNGDMVSARLTSSANANTTVSAVLNIGGVTDSLDVTTGASDTTPSQFSFVDQPNVAQSSLITSTAITVGGINATVNITSTGGSFDINNSGTFITSGTVGNGNTVRAQHTSAGASNTPTNTTVTIGGVADTFTSTTAADRTPESFADFPAQTGVTRISTRTSTAQTITQIDSGTTVTINNGAFSIPCSANSFVTSGTINNGQDICVRHMASSNFSTAVTTMLTIGTVQKNFTSTTEAQDLKADPLTFTTQDPVAKSATITSIPQTISGLNDATAISVTNGLYSIGSGPFGANPATVVNGDTVRVQHVSSANDTTNTVTTLTTGNGMDATSSTFTSKTGDGTPNAFSFAQQTVAPSATVTSAPATLGGLTIAAPISVSVGGSYSINSATVFVTAAGMVNNGDVVRVRHTAPNTFNTMTTTTLTVGGVPGGFTSTTNTQDVTPDGFSFTPVNNVARGSTQTSNAPAINGIDNGAPVSVSGGSYSIGCTSSFVNGNGSINPGQTICVRHTASPNFGTPVTTVLTVGTVNQNFVSTTEAQDIAPAPFSFTDLTGVEPGSKVVSNVITVSAINDAAPISITGGEFRIGNGAFGNTMTTVTSGQTVRVRATSGAFGATVNAVLNIGGVTDTYSLTTRATTASDVNGTPTGASATVTDSSGGAVTLGTTSGAFANVRRLPIPAGAPGDFTFPNGFFGFNLTGVAPGATVTVTLTLPAGSAPTSYIKCDGSGAICAALPAANASFAGNVVTLTLVDGGIGDSDGAADGNIQDPGGDGSAVPGVDKSNGLFGLGALNPALLGGFALAAALARRRRRFLGDCT